MDMVLFLECHSEDMQSRLLQRGKTSGRDDDNIESIKKRFTTYADSTMPLLDYMKNVGGVSVITVNASQSVQMVYKDIKIALVQLIEKDLLSANEKLVRALNMEDIDTYESMSSVSTIVYDISSSRGSSSNSVTGSVTGSGEKDATTDKGSQYHTKGRVLTLLRTRETDNSRVYYKIAGRADGKERAREEDSAPPVVKIHGTGTQATVTMVLLKTNSDESYAVAATRDDMVQNSSSGGSSQGTLLSQRAVGGGSSNCNSIRNSSNSIRNSSSSCSSCGDKVKIVLHWRLMSGKWTHMKDLSTAVPLQ